MTIFFIYLSSCDNFFLLHHLGETKLLFVDHLDKRGEACTGIGHDNLFFLPGWGMTIFFFTSVGATKYFVLKKLPSAPPDIKWCVPY